MSAFDSGRSNLAGLTLDDVLGARRNESQPTSNRTLVDVIKDDKSNKDKKSWKMFREKLRLKKAGSAWTSSVPISDVNVHSNRSQFSRRGSLRSNSADSTYADGGGERSSDSGPPAANSRKQMARRTSVRFANQTDHDGSVDASMPDDSLPSRSFKPQMTRHKSTRVPASSIDTGDDVDSSEDDSNPDSDESPMGREMGMELTGERVFSARDAVISQEAAEAAAAAAAAEENNGPAAAEEPVKMSLMDLLGESGSWGDDDEEYYDDEDDEEDEEEEEVVEASGGKEYTCCVCMVRHKGAAFITCGHSFCRLCTKELSVQRGNCPLCNGYILEILDIF